MRPIPILAPVPVAILVLAGIGAPVLVVTFVAALLVTTLSTVLGVQSIDRDMLRAASCLGARRRDVLRDVVVPGALPYVLSGLPIAMGVAWLSLVAGELLAGRRGLGDLVSSSYATTIVIATITIALVGFASSAAVRLVGRQLLAHHVRGS